MHAVLLLYIYTHIYMHIMRVFLVCKFIGVEHIIMLTPLAAHKIFVHIMCESCLVCQIAEAWRGFSHGFLEGYDPFDFSLSGPWLLCLNWWSSFLIFYPLCFCAKKLLESVYRCDHTEEKICKFSPSVICRSLNIWICCAQVLTDIYNCMDS